MSTVNDEILKELRASLVAMDNDEFNSIMDSFENAHKDGATLGFEIDSILASCIESACEDCPKVVLSFDNDYGFENQQWAA
ncbi:MAG: hypothetical protein LBR68_00355 [Lachnoclostridium sp.]|jgi:hypothetical protein|nr:hypothetical protein [Lachnoclostridium sp.]